MTTRYFGAYESLDIINEHIRAMIDAYKSNFTSDVWEGKHNPLWPLLDPHTGRSIFYKKKMSNVRPHTGDEIIELGKMIEPNLSR